jgi:hypothetical protein
MKTILFSFALLPVIAFSQNISVDMIYSLPTGNSTPKQFYPARFNSAFTTASYEQLMQISGKHITKQLAAGKKVFNYSPSTIGPVFYSSMTINECRNLPAFINYPANKIVPSQKTDVFTWKSGTAESPRVTITPDYRFITGLDSIEVPSKKGDHFDVKARAVFFHPENAALLFVESWNFNSANGTFTKNIHQCGYEEKEERFDDGFYKWTMVVDNHDSTGITKGDKIFLKNVVTDISVAYSETRISYDSLYSHITGMDALNEMKGIPGSSGNLPDGERSQFEAALLNYAYAHPEKVFPVSVGGSIDSLHALTAEKFSNYFLIMDTVFYEDPAHPGTLITAPIRTEIPMSDIYGFRFYEDWYYDPVEMIIKKKVKGIGLLMIIRDPQTGNASIRDEGLYIKMN